MRQPRRKRTERQKKNMMNKDCNEAIVSLVVERIEASGKTLTQIAKECGISTDSVKGIVQNGAMPYTVTMHRLIVGLGITEDEITERIRNGRNPK